MLIDLEFTLVWPACLEDAPLAGSASRPAFQASLSVANPVIRPAGLSLRDSGFPVGTPMYDDLPVVEEEDVVNAPF
jgi:hypothetical protein